MSEPESASEALRWLRYARDDLEVAGQMAQEAGRARYTCWFSQQATEKALKALLVLEGIDFPFTHDLEALLELHDEWPQRATRADLEQLTEWAPSPGIRGTGPNSPPRTAPALRRRRARSTTPSSRSSGVGA